MSRLSGIKASIIATFLNQSRDAEGKLPELYETPHEEILEAIQKRKSIKIFMAGGAARPASARVEENLLFDTRRYPSDTTNTLPAPSHLPAGEYNYFSSAVGQPAVNNGFATGVVMSETETNMDIPSQIAKGKDFVFHRLGLAFNAEAVASDISQLLDSGALRFVKQGGQFTLRHGRMGLWTGGVGVSGFSTVQGQQAAHNGIADPRATRELKIPRVIRNLETFSYIHVVPRPARSSTGELWQLSQFTQLSVYLWGGQRDSIPV